MYEFEQVSMELMESRDSVVVSLMEPFLAVSLEETRMKWKRSTNNWGQ